MSFRRLSDKFDDIIEKITGKNPREARFRQQIHAAVHEFMATHHLSSFDYCRAVDKKYYANGYTDDAEYKVYQDAHRWCKKNVDGWEKMGTAAQIEKAIDHGARHISKEVADKTKLDAKAFNERLNGLDF
jgi:hypothetical protein